MEIRKLNTGDIPAVSALHRRTLPTTIARIGPPYLSDLYTALLPDICLVAVERQKIIGVITATKQLDVTQKRLGSLLFRPKNALSIIWALVSGRIFLGELISRVLFERELAKHFPPPYATILTFFVDASYRQKGVGTRLFEAILKVFPKKTTLYVDTEETNAIAQKWYESRGFQKKTAIGGNVIYSFQL